MLSLETVAYSENIEWLFISCTCICAVRSVGVLIARVKDVFSSKADCDSQIAV